MLSKAKAPYGKWITIIAGFAVFCISLLAIHRERPRSGVSAAEHPFRLYWFIPDGLRADPEVFDVFRWAREGELPNFRRMMRDGAYGFSIPVFPTHTPVNYATLFTGVTPARNGVADGPIRLWGYPLNMVSRSGFSSLAKTIDPIWYTLERAGLILSLMTVPGSTPPEIDRGQVVKGRWGGWGIDFPNVIFHSHADRQFRERLGWNAKVFQIEKRLTEFVRAGPPRDWEAPLPPSHSPLREVNFRNWDADLFALIADSSDDGRENYDTLHLSVDKKAFLFSLKEGQWSEWFPFRVHYEMSRDYQDEAPQRARVERALSRVPFDLRARLRVIKLGDRDFFRVRMLYEGLNESLTLPQSLHRQLTEAAGPMVDFVDNYPPQLIYFAEDKKVFQEEAEMSFDYHERAQSFFLREVAQDVYVHSIYTPNQMLTSRWWMKDVDPHSARYHEATAAERAQSWREVLDMYKRIDKMLGEALDRRGPNSYVVLSSDHGVAPLNREVLLNNLFARQGWLKFHYDDREQIYKIDWPKTKVVFLKMNHVYIHPRGLAGDYQPASGAEYEELRRKVMDSLRGLKDDHGALPLAEMHTREDAGQMGLPPERVGDLVIANSPGFNWIEDVTAGQEIFRGALISGYKQALPPESTTAVWTPFLIVGPGIKPGHRIPKPISHLDQYPTIMKLLGIEPPYQTDRPPLAEIFTGR